MSVLVLFGALVPFNDASEEKLTALNILLRALT